MSGLLRRSVQAFGVLDTANPTHVPCMTVGVRGVSLVSQSLFNAPLTTTFSPKEWMTTLTIDID